MNTCFKDDSVDRALTFVTTRGLELERGLFQHASGGVFYPTSVLELCPNSTLHTSLKSY